MSPVQSLGDTLRALTAPRRAGVIAVAAVPLLWAQAAWNPDPLVGLLAGASLILGALGVGPAAWRIFGGRPGGLWRYGLACLIGVFVFGVALPRTFDFEDRFLTQPATVPFLLGLFAAVGHGLGRDIEDERRFAAAEAQAEALRRDRERAELLALRAQLDPHFLFNTLSAIAEWCHSDPMEAERAILRLADLLRGVQRGVQRSSWPLREELGLVRDLLDLYHARDPGRYTYAIEGDPPELDVPPLILLPLVENAIKHGPAAGHAGPVRITVQAVGAGVQIGIQNPGPLRGPREGGEGLALTRRRLALAYGQSALELVEEGGGTRTRLWLPVAPREGG